MDTLTSVIELGVGAGCLAGGIAAMRAPRPRVLAVLLTVAGSVAVAHAVAALVAGR
jgi:methylase of polypeptide subunit release factors